MGWVPHLDLCGAEKTEHLRSKIWDWETQASGTFIWKWPEDWKPLAPPDRKEVMGMRVMNWILNCTNFAHINYCKVFNSTFSVLWLPVLTESLLYTENIILNKFLLFPAKKIRAHKTPHTAMQEKNTSFDQNILIKNFRRSKNRQLQWCFKL